MRILLLRNEPSTRARVHASALRAVHPRIELALARQGGPGGEPLERQWRLGLRPARGLREAIAEFGPDVIHSYAPPSGLTICANELSARRVAVVHDVGSIGEFGEDPELESRAIEESDALIVPSQRLLDEIASRCTLPPLISVFADYPLARELSGTDDELSAEANIDRIATLYEQLAREPFAGIAAELRGH